MRLANMPRLHLFIPLLLLVSGSALAQDAEEERPFDASVALGYVGTSGNTEVQTMTTEFLLTYRDIDWTHNLKFQSLTSKNSDGRTKAERYFLENKSDFTLMNEDEYLYVQASFRDDRFSGYHYQATVSAGYGRYLIRNDNLILEGFTGLGYRQNDEILGGVRGEAVFSLGESIDWDISDTTSVQHELVAEIGQDRTITTFEISLESDILDRLTTKIGFQARHSSKVPLGTQSRDTQTSISLVYTF